MDAEDDREETVEEEAAASQEEDVIAENLPCVHCEYNLRGLNEEGRCPECGTAIEKTVAYVMQRMLCPTCLAPNHPARVVCVSCGSPLTGAGATANYFRTTAIGGGRRKKRDYEEEPEPPSTLLVGACFTLGVAGIFTIGATLRDEWAYADAAGEGEPWLWTALGAMGIFAILALMYYPARAFWRKRRVYRVEHAAFMAKEIAADEAEAAARRARGSDVAGEIEDEEER